MVCDRDFRAVDRDGDVHRLIRTGAGVTAMRVWLLCAVIGLLAACGAAVDAPFAPDDVVRAKAYRDAGPPSITVLTVVSNRSGSGAHSALMINGSQRVIFDPAGSFFHETVPERNDVLFGITPAVLQAYRGAHARLAYHVVSQKMIVTPEQAETALRLVQAYGAVPQAFCTQATTGVLAQVPGFDDIRSSFFPGNLMDQIAGRPGVETDKYFENDDGDILDGVARIDL